ncbi:zinc-binding metallopeptidase family protein [Rhizosaccharibacter radicis]|uniref:Zinc-binding peptidase n=1 Tax=Rhizosaccharibacter radicis TaxID=2782605 RepID=A0ABT1VXG7_9PROT|nr:putative zinc-binding peptidase [Acetobacteraceae bacterium KSS12]
MKLFNCQNCGNLLFFENTNCEQCGSALGYLPDQEALSALTPDGEAMVAPGRRVRLCTNAELGACNWLVDADSAEAYCAACRHNRTIPALDDTDTRLLWRQLEVAKHRLFYSLIRLGIPLPNRNDDPVEGLVFDFLADLPGGPKVMTGHDNGVITINVHEADDAHREQMRHQMHETYRTLLGHFRHEVGHWIWDKLVRDGGRLDAFRALFGDDRQDYGAALQRHYEQGAPAEWQDRAISAYATSHPWEDFAETWAHYLHIMDTLETANAFGLGVKPKVPHAEGLVVEVAIDPYRSMHMDEIVDQWVPLVFAVNSLNRSMGLSDLYPFVISETVRDKLGFIHAMLHDAPAATA